MDITELLAFSAKQGASDLHLSAGLPPMIRVDGEMQIIEGEEVLDNERLDKMLREIMPERNVAEYDECNDTDFGYTLEGTGRFRANIFKDRNELEELINYTFSESLNKLISI